MKTALVRAASAATVLLSLGFASSANAAALYFEKATVKTGSEATCLRFASDVASSQGFRNMHKSSAEVAGEKDGAYVAITCVGRGQQAALAVVMSMSQEFNVARQVGNSIAGKMRGITCIDSC